MDANGTRFQLLLGKADWRACTSDGVRLADAGPAGAFDWDGVRHELRLRPLLLRTRERATGHPAPPSPADRRGAARDRYGNWYWIDAGARLIWVQGSCDREPARYWPPLAPPRTPRFGSFHAAAPLALPPGCRYAGLAVTEDHYLVVGVVDAPGLLVWDLHQGGSPSLRRWPAAIPFAPFDFAATPGGGLAILDRSHARWWALDRHLAVIRRDQADVELAPAGRAAFQPVDGPVRETPAVTFPAGLAVSEASPLTGLDAIAIEALADGSVLILERDARIHRFRDGTPLGVAVAELSRLVDGDPALVAHDFAVAGDRLYIVDGDGDQAFAFALALAATDFTLELQPEFLPLRLFGGKALVNAGGTVFYDFANRWVELVDKRRPRFVAEGELETPIFDGRQPQCVWHRLLLDATIPAEAVVTVASRAADDPADLARLPWQAEPALLQRADGSEQPHLGRDPANRATFELLFQAARGRYLQLQLRLAGDGRTSPRLRALRAYYPRFSYLERYLPGVYREDETSASFLERFLANPEGFFTAIEDKIAAAQILFDPGAAPAEVLDWLTSWFGLLGDPAWSEPRRRLFLKHIMTFFQWRGTRRGLELALRLALDACADDTLFSATRDPIAGIRIVERYGLLTVPAVALGDPSAEPRRVPRTERWEPAQGAGELRERWAAWLAASELPARAYPVRDPHDASAPAWRSFNRAVLGFIPAAGAADAAAWHDFLARRYRRPSALARAWGSEITSWADAALPVVLPTDGAPLVDWYVFERVVLGVAAYAHRFTVLLPVERDRPYDVAAHEERRRLARRVVEAERPAHTQFDVKLYWAMTRVGEARLGVDTLLDVGSRAPQLLPPMILGQGYLAESYLAASPPEDALDRTIVGRDALARREMES